MEHDKIDLELTDVGTDIGRPEAAIDSLFHPARTDDERKREKEILDSAKPCPFCGSENLTVGWWCLDNGDVEAIECSNCYAGAPAAAWSKRA